MNFYSGEEMLEVLQDGTDLYSPDIEEYVFLYNDCGSIASYSVNKNQAVTLERMVLESDMEEYWGAFLGPGGWIYDDPSYDGFSSDQTSNLDYCNKVYEYNWIPTTEVLNYVA